MRRLIILLFVLFVVGCTPVTNESVTTTTLETVDLHASSDFMLTDSELEKFGLVGADCLDDLEGFFDNSNPERNCVGNYSFTNYNSTGVFVIVSKYDNFNDLNGSYGYESSHYFSAQGLIGKDEFGDMSTFRLSNENDYGGEFNDPNVYVYHLWITKDLFMIHITSKGEDVKDSIVEIANTILEKFD